VPEELAEGEETRDDEQRVVRSIVAGVRARLRVQTRVMPIGARRALVFGSTDHRPDSGTSRGHPGEGHRREAGPWPATSPALRSGRCDRAPQLASSGVRKEARRLAAG
jgi:hypothetical protein